MGGTGVVVGANGVELATGVLVAVLVGVGRGGTGLHCVKSNSTSITKPMISPVTLHRLLFAPYVLLMFWFPF